MSIKRIFAPKEVKITLNMLDNFCEEFKSQGIEEIRDFIEEGILSDFHSITSKVKDTDSARQFLYFAIANVAGDYVESGRYHLYRGVLNPVGLGPKLLNLFDTVIDRLLADGAITEDVAKEQKAGLRQNIKGVG